MCKERYIQAMDNIPFSGDMEERIYKRLQDERVLYRKKRLCGAASAIGMAAVFLIVCIFHGQTLHSNYLSKTELNQLESIDDIREYSVTIGSVISEKEILTDEMLIINVSGSSEEKGAFTIQGEMTGDDLIYDIGYILDGHYTELDALNTDAVLDTKVEVKENTEFSWCITNRAESALNLSGMVSVIYDDLFYRNYGEGVIDIDTLCNITIHDISSLVAKEDLEGIYLYNCKTRESKKMAAALGNLEFQISTPGKYIIYAMTQESEVLNLMNFITVESVATDEQEKIIGL